MQTNHAIVMGRAPRLTTQRLMGFVFAGLLQVAAIWALIEGLNIKVWPIQDPHTTVDFVKNPDDHGRPPPPNVTLVDPGTVTVSEPTWTSTPDPDSHAITANNGPANPVSDYGAAGIRETHTIPPYPPIAIRLGEAGTVRLHLTISPQGQVTEAVIVRSSGYDDLDRAAQSWVLAHWRYHPASHAGTPVMGGADAEVLFDLQNAH
ncbi:MAG: energy transducer TonB [Rhizomicrobium sp.]